MARPDLSGSYAEQWPEFRRERHRGRWLGTSVTVALPLSFTVGGSAEMRWTDYERGWFPFVADGGPREDRTWSWRLSAYNQALTVLGFSPELAVVRETLKSNAQLHDYRRTSGELRFVQQSSHGGSEACAPLPPASALLSLLGLLSRVARTMHHRLAAGLRWRYR